MMRTTAVALLLFAINCFAGERPASQPPCKIYFGVVWTNAAGKVSRGLSAEETQWFQQKLAEKYPDVCYAGPSAAAAVYFNIAESEVSRSGVYTSSVGYGPVVERTSQPYVASSTYYILSITASEGGATHVLRTFKSKERVWLRSTCGPALTHCGPSQRVFEKALKWVHEGGVAKSVQGTAVKK